MDSLHQVSTTSSTSAMRVVIPRDSLFYAEPNPVQMNKPLPTGWREMRLMDASNNYEGTTSDERLVMASTHAQLMPQKPPVRRAPVSAARDALTQIDKRGAVSLKKQTIEAELRQRESLRAEGERLGALLAAAPPVPPGLHMMHRHVAKAHNHFTTRDQNFVRYHRNLMLPLDTPMDFEDEVPMVPRAWKLAASKSMPSLNKRLPGIRTKPATAHSSLNSSLASLGSHQQPSAALLASPSPKGLSGLPNSLPARKIRLEFEEAYARKRRSGSGVL